MSELLLRSSESAVKTVDTFDCKREKSTNENKELQIFTCWSKSSPVGITGEALTVMKFIVLQVLTVSDL